jgi:predicted metal-dependent hydrolase
MIDWLRRSPTPQPERGARRVLELDGRDLPLAIRRLRTARRMTLRLSPDGSEARITMPPWGRIGEAIAFAEDRRNWLASQLAALPGAQPIVMGGTLPYRGEALRIEWCDDAPRRPTLDDGAVVLGGPHAALEARLRRWLEKEALRLFAADAADYAGAAGLATPRVLLTRAKRRWGSCTADGTVRLNWRLVMAPDLVRRSVVAHEIAHLVHFDHGPRFHAVLARIYDGDLVRANRWLKREGRSLYAVFP